jgi:hypothetical protein
MRCSVPAAGVKKEIDYAWFDVDAHARSFDVEVDLIGGDIGGASLSAAETRGGLLLGGTEPPDAEAASAIDRCTALVAVRPDPERHTAIRYALAR